MCPSTSGPRSCGKRRENEFEGDEIVLTTSEFWKPQISLQAAQIRLNDRTQEADPDGIVRDSAFDVELKKVRFKYGNVTLLALPTIRANRERPDLPIRSINAGYDRRLRRLARNPLVSGPDSRPAPAGGNG